MARRAQYFRVPWIVVFAGSLVCSAGVSAHATSPLTVIHVPGDQPTIQAAIDVAVDGDVVAVDPGTYIENLDLEGKAIRVASTTGPMATLIDGGAVAPVVTIASGEGRTTVIEGFTLQNGMSTFESGYAGGGVYVSGSSPTIVGNRIVNNAACSEGGGIGVSNGGPLIKNNQILYNVQSGCSGGNGGGGIALLGGSGSIVLNNLIAHNTWGSWGGGLGLNGGGDALIANNVIRDNDGGQQGGGIWMVNSSSEAIIQNLIVGNTADEGGGVYWSIPSGDEGLQLLNNTVADNSASQGSGLWGGGFQSQVTVTNNIIKATQGQ